MTIDLSTARNGQRYEARNGEVWTYVREIKLQPHNDIFYECQRRNGRWKAFYQNGRSSKEDQPDDLIRALDDPAPVEAGQTDAEFAVRLRKLANRIAPNGMKIPNGIAAGEETDAALIEAATRIEAMAAEIEALTRAVEKAQRERDEHLSTAFTAAYELAQALGRASRAEFAVEEARKMIERDGGPDA